MHTGTLSLILTTYNDEASLAAVVHACLGVLPDHFADFEIIIVDDGSSDATPQIADQQATTYEPIMVLHHRRNRGYGAAIISGCEAARGDYCLLMDAGGQFSISDLARLMPYLDRYKFVAGYRLHHRAASSVFFNVVGKLLFGLKLRDSGCGFALIHADLLRDMHLTSWSRLIAIEMRAKAVRAGARLIEVGVNYHPHAAGRQHGSGIRAALRVCFETLALWRQMQQYTPAGAPTVRSRWRQKALIGSALAAVLGGAWTARRRR